MVVFVVVVVVVVVESSDWSVTVTHDLFPALQPPGTVSNRNCSICSLVGRENILPPFACPVFAFNHEIRSSLKLDISETQVV